MNTNHDLLIRSLEEMRPIVNTLLNCLDRTLTDIPPSSPSVHADLFLLYAALPTENHINFILRQLSMTENIININA